MTASFEYRTPSAEMIAGSIQQDVTRYIDAVCAEVDINVAELLSESRHQSLVELRYLLTHIMRNDFGLLHTEIASLLNRKNHASSCHGIKRLEWWVKHDQTGMHLNKCLQAAENVFQNQFNRSLKITRLWHTKKK